MTTAHLAAPPAAAVPPGYVPVSALIEAREEVESWAAYASPYFQDKHDLAGVLAKIDGQIAAATQAPPAAAVKKYMNWQPIETAPKDGCVIMLWCGDVDFGYYSKAGWRICNNGDYRDGGHGQDYLCGTDHHSQYAPPTHWMPLPEPPKDAECSPEGVP